MDYKKFVINVILSIIAFFMLVFCLFIIVGAFLWFN